MALSDALKPTFVFAAVVVVTVGVAFAGFAVLGGGDGATGSDYSAQSPDHFQPDNVLADSDPESGTIEIDAGTEGKRILVDTKHSNEFDRPDVEPLAEALARNGHTVDFEGSGEDSGFSRDGYSNATLQQFDAVLIVQPTTSFSDGEVSGLRAFADGDGRIAVLAEPTQYQAGSSLGSSATVQQFGANGLAAEFGVRIGSDSLYNIDDDANDNNYASIYADPVGDGVLTDGVDRVQFDTAGYVVRVGSSDAEMAVRAVEGTSTLDRRETARYPIAAQNGNFVFVADTSFLEQSELYDVDNEQFVGNVLEFLVSGDKADDVPAVETGATTPDQR